MYDIISQVKIVYSTLIHCLSYWKTWLVIHMHLRSNTLCQANYSFGNNYASSLTYSNILAWTPRRIVRVQTLQLISCNKIEGRFSEVFFSLKNSRIYQLAWISLQEKVVLRSSWYNFSYNSIIIIPNISAYKTFFKSPKWNLEMWNRLIIQLAA